MQKKRIHKPFKRNISRRSFINRTLSVASGIAIYPLLSDNNRNISGKNKWPENAKKYRFHLIGHAHIDPVWLWPWPEGLAVVHSTFRSLLDLMNENPDITFAASSAQFYQWIADNDPGMIQEIKQRVDEGRWNIVGGWWVEPDMNIPCGESMVRQGLYGQLTLEKLIGHRSVVAFNPDSFGHANTVPQIIHLQGMDNYVFMRPNPVEKSISDDLFWWQGPDGIKVMTYRIPLSYNDTGSVRSKIEQVSGMLQNKDLDTVMTFYGAGDHGGGTTRDNIASIIEIQKEIDAPEILFSTPEKYFTEVRGKKNFKLNVVNDDLQHHAAGCYTAESEIKKNNRAAETALITAEKIASVGSVKWGYRYPMEEFTNAWKRVLFLQFHDSLAGTSLPGHSASAREGFYFARDTASQAAYKALQKLEWMVAAEDPESQYLLVFNPHAWETESYIEYEISWDKHIPAIAEDENGNQLAYQWISGSTVTGNRTGILIKVHIPAFGYRQIRIKPGAPAALDPRIRAENNTIENETIRITVSKSGTVGIFDKVSEIEVFNGGETGCRTLVIDDKSDTWSHDVKAFRNVIGYFGNPEISIIEKGPVRSIIRSKSTYGRSSLIIEWILYSEKHFVEARINLDWQEQLKMLKFSFPVNVKSPSVTYETPYGHIVRTTNGDEEPGQRWVDMTGDSKGGKYGLTLINDAKYGYSAENNDMRISVTRSSVYAHHNPRKLESEGQYLWQDQGIQTFRMLLFPHKNTWQEAEIPRITEEFIAPPLSIYQGIHRGKLQKSDSFIKAEPNNIIIAAIKQSENSNDLILRCIETSGKYVTSKITLSFAGCEWEGNFRPCEIKTLRINIPLLKISEVNLLEEEF